MLLLRALTSFYVSLGSFAAAALISVLGAAAAGGDHQAVLEAVRATALAIGFVGVGGLVFGCSLLVAETRLTLLSLRDEANYSEQRFRTHSHPDPRSSPVARGPVDPAI